MKALIFRQINEYEYKVEIKKLKTQECINSMYPTKASILLLKKRKDFPCFIERNGRLLPFYVLSNDDTSDFDAIREVSDSLRKSKVFALFWTAVYRYATELSWRDLIIIVGLPVAMALIVEFFQSGAI